MQTTIVARVAEYIRDPEARKMIEQSAGTASLKVQDAVTLSHEGRRRSEELTKTTSEWEKNRVEHVDSVVDRVRTQTYKMAPEMVDQLAQQIVAIL